MPVVFLNPAPAPLPPPPPLSIDALAPRSAPFVAADLDLAARAAAGPAAAAERLAAARSGVLESDALVPVAITSSGRVTGVLTWVDVDLGGGGWVTARRGWGGGGGGGGPPLAHATSYGAALHTLDGMWGDEVRDKRAWEGEGRVEPLAPTTLLPSPPRPPRSPCACAGARASSCSLWPTRLAACRGTRASRGGTGRCWPTSAARARSRAARRPPSSASAPPVCETCTCWMWGLVAGCWACWWPGERGGGRREGVEKVDARSRRPPLHPHPSAPPAPASPASSKSPPWPPPPRPWRPRRASGTE